MMNMRGLALKLLLAASILITPAIASAGSGPVHNFLSGGLVDPAATMLRVVPPRGAAVMVHRQGKLLAWLPRAGYLTLAPNQRYQIVVTRGSAMLFNQAIWLRHGHTELRWDPSGAMQYAYQPTAMYGQRYHASGVTPWHAPQPRYAGQRHQTAEPRRSPRPAPRAQSSHRVARPSQARANSGQRAGFRSRAGSLRARAKLSQIVNARRRHAFSR